MTRGWVDEVPLVCRWRLVSGRVPLLNRHLRALSNRRFSGERLGVEFMARLRQYLEWDLESATRDIDDAVLAISVDTGMRASAAVLEYRPLASAATADLIMRANVGRRQAEAFDVSPDDLWVVRGGRLEWAQCLGSAASGTSTLVADLARTLGIKVCVSDDLLDEATGAGLAPDVEVFLASDEHGVIAATDRPNRLAGRFEASYRTLVESERKKAGR